jgi:hypothetical protein
VLVLSEKHRIIKKNFETEMWVDGKKLSLNNMMQETIANVLTGFSKTLKGMEAEPEPTKIEVKIRKLGKHMDVNAHICP